jgi:hypothetical protein
VLGGAEKVEDLVAPPEEELLNCAGDVRDGAAFVGVLGVERVAVVEDAEEVWSDGGGEEDAAPLDASRENEEDLLNFSSVFLYSFTARRIGRQRL